MVDVCLAVGCVLGWPRNVLLLLQPPLCSLAVAMALDRGGGGLWLSDRCVGCATPMLEGFGRMAALVGMKHRVCYPYVGGVWTHGGFSGDEA